MNTDAILEREKLIADAVDGAEDMPDPLAALAEKTAADPGAPRRTTPPRQGPSIIFAGLTGALPPPSRARKVR